jgi:hypothetical protein
VRRTEPEFRGSGGDRELVVLEPHGPRRSTLRSTSVLPISVQPTFGARIVATWPAIALLLAVEMLSRVLRTSTALAEDLSRPVRSNPLNTVGFAAVPAGSGRRYAPTMP